MPHKTMLLEAFYLVMRIWQEVGRGNWLFYNEVCDAVLKVLLATSSKIEIIAAFNPL